MKKGDVAALLGISAVTRRITCLKVQMKKSRQDSGLNISTVIGSLLLAYIMNNLSPYCTTKQERGPDVISM